MGLWMISISFILFSLSQFSYNDDILFFIYEKMLWDFPGGAVVRNPLTNTGDTGLSPGPGRSHMPWSN